MESDGPIEAKLMHLSHYFFLSRQVLLPQEKLFYLSLVCFGIFHYLGAKTTLIISSNFIYNTSLELLLKIVHFLLMPRCCLRH